MYPIYGGVGAVNVTTKDRNLADLARRLLEELKWHGPAQIEFKYDGRDNTYKLIEMNPKLWGTLDLSIKAGVDFPRLIRDYLMGDTVERDVAYPEGIRYIFLFPRATIAFRELVAEFGLREIFDPARYSRTYYDVDIRDLPFDLFRMYSAFRSFLDWSKEKSPHANLNKSCINRVRQTTVHAH
jgi:hypothetical protein